MPIIRLYAQYDKGSKVSALVIHTDKRECPKKQHVNSRCSGNIMTFDDRINGILSDASYPIGPIRTSDEEPALEVRKTAAVNAWRHSKEQGAITELETRLK